MMPFCPREVTEALEREYLSPYATLSAESKGRKVIEEKCPLRTEFQRDRDRIIHSKAFRRLMHKTQVFIAPRGDHYRTRLTHTLEVSQIARTICRALRLNDDLAEAISLGHDLGHPPFGHAGEDALDRAYRRHDPNARFRHFEQSVRVVEVLEKDGRGLNLTFEVLDGMANHSKGLRDLGFSEENPSNIDIEKAGVYEPSTVEGQVVRIADRIAYVNHDLDDAIRAGIASAEQIPQFCRQVLGETHAQRITSMVADVIAQGVEDGRIRMSETTLQAMNALKDFLVESVYYNVTHVKAETEKVERVVVDLFDHYMSHPEEIPITSADKSKLSQPALARIVCDYIAGMTDRYAIDQFNRIFVPRGWQVA